MDLKYDISKYITKTRMSSKKRILVEGSDDKSHIKNLLDVLCCGHKVKIDTAENIKGVCKKTARNNRAKIDEIFSLCNSSAGHQNLFYLCDREYTKFDVDSKINDLMVEHEFDRNLTWTIGHSIENYFFKDNLLTDAYRFLCGSEYKSEAIALFRKVLPSAFEIIAAICLAARNLEKSSYPIGVIHWSDFRVNDECLYLKIDDWSKNNRSQIAMDFCEQFKKHLPVAKSTSELICSRFCRGHTAMIMIQRVFSICIYKVISDIDRELALKDAKIFSKLKESLLANALCESWVRQVKVGEAVYPTQLIESVAS
jgi:hypothetical protein